MCNGHVSFARAQMQANPEIRERFSQSETFATLRDKQKQTNIDGEPFWLVEGDMLVDEDELLIYAQTREQSVAYRRLANAFGMGAASFAASPSPWLLGMTENGKTVRWPNGTKLTYRIAKASFTGDFKERYDRVREEMASATRDWEDTCGVLFQHLSDLDERPGVAPEGAIFTVRQINAGGAFIAAAFFANDPISRRRVLLDESYFSGNDGFNRMGVLRHELGHVLGFRHEHIRSGAPAVCQGESLADTVALGDYDPQSVMHYFCGNVGTKELRITATDRVGAQMLYGPPLKSIQFVSV